MAMTLYFNKHAVVSCVPFFTMAFCFFMCCIFSPKVNSSHFFPIADKDSPILLNTKFFIGLPNKSWYCFKNGLTYTPAFSSGFFTESSAIFFITLFGVVLNTDNTERLIIYGLYMALATFIWFSFIGYVFTSQVFKSRFIKFFGYFEKGLGLILVIIAMQLIISEYL